MAEPRRAARAADPTLPGRAGGRARRSGKQIALTVLTWVGALAVVGGILAAAAFAVVYSTTPIPDPNRDFQTNVSRVLYRDGTTEVSTYFVQNRRTIPLAEMSVHARDAIVAAENEEFWTDPGVSFVGLLRAVRTAVTPGVDTVGGSTITQQYVKVLYLTQDKTITRKLTEIIIALKVSREVPKEDILEGYLNTVYFGRGAYGLQAASQAYFGIDAKDLDLPQSIALTAIINSPNNLDPAKGEKQRADLLERYQYAINQMVKTGKMTEDQKSQLYTSLPDFPKLVNDSRLGGPKGFLMEMVKQELTDQGFGADQIEGGGLQIVTTIDPRLQEAAVQAAQNQATRIAAEQDQDPLYYHPAIASVDTTNGAVLALYGGPDFTTEYTNWATTPRPTGSTFKPWALVAGLREGAKLNDRFNGDEFTPPGADRPITNAGGREYGPVTLEQATTQSINTAYVDLVMQMDAGPEKVIRAAEDVGIRNSGWDPQPSIPLGYAEVSPLDAARGLATLVNEGRRTTPHLVTEVKDASGQVLYRSASAGDQTVEAEIAQNAVAALTKVTQSGTARSVSALGHDVAGKTGTYYLSTTEETRSTWFIGATKQISTAFVLTAGPNGTSDLGRNTYGSTYAAQGWLEYMRVAMEGLEKIDFPDATRDATRSEFTPPPRTATATPTRTPTPTQTPTPTPTPEPTPEPTPTPEPEPEPTPEPTPEPKPQPKPTSAQPTPPGTSPTPGNRGRGGGSEPRPTPTP